MALVRALYRRGASFTAAMVFEIASTNLIIELGITLALMISWQFTLAEFTGGPVMIVLVAVAFRLFVRGLLVQAARPHPPGVGRAAGNDKTVRKAGRECRAPEHDGLGQAGRR